MFQAGLLSIVFEQDFKGAGEVADFVLGLAVLQCNLKITLRNLRRLADDIGNATNEPTRDEPSGKRNTRRLSR